MSINQVVALDLETTGLGKTDRILEIGIVCFDPETSVVVGELETLVNPLRNVPEDSSRVHGLKAADLSLAPAFEDIAADLLKFLHGKKIVAHNADFDLRFLKQEFQRVGMSIDFKDIDCTMRLSGQSLPVACEQISYEFAHHSALEDAKASLAIWASETRDLDPMQLFCQPIGLLQRFRTLTRSQVGLEPIDTRLSSLSSLALQFDQDGVDRTYIGLLDAYLRDFQITDLEAFGIREYALLNGISETRELELQDIYLAEIENAALRDGIITDSEAQFFNSISSALGFTRRLESTSGLGSLPSKGALVCVTGTATVDGVKYDKGALSKLLTANGYTFTDAISKKAGVQLLLQESEGSQSSKVVKAQAWGIPRMVISDFVRLVQES